MRQLQLQAVLLVNNGEKARKAIAEYTPRYSSIEEYCEEMDKICRIKKAVEYNDDGSANLKWI